MTSYSTLKAQSLTRRRSAGHDTSMRDARHMRNKVNRLMERGFSSEAIATPAAIDRGTVCKIASGERRTCSYQIYEALKALTESDIYGYDFPDLTMVASYASVRRIQALYRIGWTRDILNPLIEAENPDFLGDNPLNATPLDFKKRTKISYGKHKAIRKVYDRLYLTQGPSERNRKTSAFKGWAAPLAWDDIENYTEIPKGVTDEVA